MEPAPESCPNTRQATQSSGLTKALPPDPVFLGVGGGSYVVVLGRGEVGRSVGKTMEAEEQDAVAVEALRRGSAVEVIRRDSAVRWCSAVDAIKQCSAVEGG